MLPLPDEMIVNRGQISEDKTYINKYSTHVQDLCVGEFNDVLSVAYGLKPMAILDYSMNGRKYYAQQHDCAKINEIIDICHKNDIYCLHYQTSLNIYTKSIFFHKDNFMNALKMMGIIWFGYSPDDTLEYMIGILLGYQLENIRAYYKHNGHTPLSLDDETKIQSIIDSMKITFDDLNKLANGNLLLMKQITYLPKIE
jgi:hypothetical protein